MGFKDITAGNKTAKPIAARFIKAKTGTLGMEVAFKFVENGQDERLNWVGWLSSGAIENTMKTLVDVLGYNGNDAVDANGVLVDPKALDYLKEVSLVVELERYQGQDGTEKSSPKIKFVNKLGGSQFENCTPEVIKNDLHALGFKAAFLAARQSHPQVAKKQEPVQQTFTDEDVPF